MNVSPFRINSLAAQICQLPQYFRLAPHLGDGMAVSDSSVLLRRTFPSRGPFLGRSLAVMGQLRAAALSATNVYRTGCAKSCLLQITGKILVYPTG
jgi:hypothetical protein